MLLDEGSPDVVGTETPSYGLSGSDGDGAEDGKEGMGKSQSQISGLSGLSGQDYETLNEFDV